MEKHKLYLDKLNEFYSKNSFLYKDELMQNTLLRVMGKDVISSNTTNVQPVWVGIKITGRCNLKCEHCWARK